MCVGMGGEVGEFGCCTKPSLCLDCLVWRVVFNSGELEKLAGARLRSWFLYISVAVSVFLCSVTVSLLGGRVLWVGFVVWWVLWVRGCSMLVSQRSNCN